MLPHAQIAGSTSPPDAAALYQVHLWGQRQFARRTAGGNSPALFRDQNTDQLLQNGIQYAFIVKFDNLADRDYYVNECPTHKAFKDVALPLIEKAIVVDFTDGLFD